MSPGFEPGSGRVSADCSTTEPTHLLGSPPRRGILPDGRCVRWNFAEFAPDPLEEQDAGNERWTDITFRIGLIARLTGRTIDEISRGTRENVAPAPSVGGGGGNLLIDRLELTSQRGECAPDRLLTIEAFHRARIV